MAPLNVGCMGYGFSTKCFHLPFVLPNPDLKVYAFLQRAEAPASKEGRCRERKALYGRLSRSEALSNRRWVFCGQEHRSCTCMHTPWYSCQVCGAGTTGGQTWYVFDNDFTDLKNFWLTLLKVVVEKSFTVSSEEAERVIATAKKSDKILTIFQSMQKIPPFIRCFVDDDVIPRSSIRLRLPHAATPRREIRVRRDHRMWNALRFRLPLLDKGLELSGFLTQPWHDVRNQY